MSTSFRNFLITFGVCLLVFGLIGWKLVYPVLNDAINGSEAESTVSDESFKDTSSVVGTEESTVEGDTFTAVIVGKSTDGFAASVMYFRVNEATKRFSYCFIPTDLKVGNGVGIDVPLKTLVPQLSGEQIAAKVSAVTGMRINYYIIMGQDELIAVVNKMNNATIDISSELKYINPEYTDEAAAFDTSDAIPAEYYITVSPGRNVVNADLVKQIMGYDAGTDSHPMTKLLYETLFEQFFTNAGTKNESAPYALLNDVKQTNITPAVIDEYRDIIFTYDLFQREKITYPMVSASYDWEEAIKLFKKADGQ